MTAPKSSDINMGIWNRLRTPPPTALKEIKGGRLKGKSDINPQWRWQALTEEFGPCGIGWAFGEVDRWTQDGADGEVMCFVKIHLKFRTCGVEPSHVDVWSDAIEGIGGSKLAEMEKGGLHNNDEGWKMATTDALGTAGKYLGLAADIYLGGKGSTGSKYDRDAPAQKPRAPKSEAGDPPAHTPRYNKEALGKYERRLLENWAKDGHLQDTKYGRDVLGILVYCKGCLGPVNAVRSSNPKAPEFVCMGTGSEAYCASMDKDGKVLEDDQGKPFRLGWWKGEWYSVESGGYPYSGISPKDHIAKQ